MGSAIVAESRVWDIYHLKVPEVAFEVNESAVTAVTNGDLL